MVPKLPTDNLYKFVALSGLVLFIGAGYLRMSQQIQLHKDFASLNSDVTSLNFILTRLKEDVAALAPEKKGPFIVSGRVYETQIEARAALHQKELEVNDLGAKYKQQQEVLKASSDNLERLWYVAQCTQWFGFLQMVSGFILWYRKVQRFHDLILVNESRSINPRPKSMKGAAEDESSVEFDSL